MKEQEAVQTLPGGLPGEEITVLEIYPRTKKATRAMVTLSIGRIKMRGWRILEKPGRGLSVAAPLQVITTSVGETTSFPLAALPGDLFQRVSEVVLDAYRKKMGVANG